jgi:cell division protein ZapA
MSDTANAVKIHIMDKEYLVACPKEEQDALLESARYLNERMTDIRESGKVVGIDRIAVITALNMAHDIIAAGPASDSVMDNCGERIRQLNTRIGEALDNYKLAGLN